jgi:hypothetical protein
VTGIAKDYAQARLTVHIRCLADTNEKTAWTASAETTLELQLPPVIEEEREPDDENSLTE